MTSSWTPPIPDQLEEISTLVDEPRKRAHFFKRLKNPEWVAPLREHGFFASPPKACEDEWGTTCFPMWPEGLYLARMASLAPDAVLAVLEETAPSDNPTVTGYLLSAVDSLPDDHLRRISKRITEWLKASDTEYYAWEAIDAVSRLLDAGQIEDGLAAARVILELKPDPRDNKKLESLLHARPRPMGKFPAYDDEYPELEYQSILEILSNKLITKTGLNGFIVLSSILEDMLSMNDRVNERYKSGSYSHIWRPEVDRYSKGEYHGIEHDLVTVVCGAAQRLSGQSEGDLKSVIQHLESSTLFHIRIALHVLAFSEHGANLVAERISNRGLFDDHRLRHEFATLLRQRFGDADPDAQRKVLGWIASGPDIETYLRYGAVWDDPPPSDTDAQRYADCRRRDWYGVIEKHLDGSDRETYLRLVSELGPPEEPDFPKLGCSGWTGPESPLTVEEMRARSPRSVVGYLRRWRPADDPGKLEMPSVEGLGLALEDVVLWRADDYAPLAESFIGLHPVYLAGFFAGLASGFRRSAFSWCEPLKLADLVTSHPHGPAGDAAPREQRRGWQRCRREIAALLGSGFANPDHQIPFEWRASVWRLLARLAADPCPPPEPGGSDADPSDALAQSMDDNPAMAMHVVIGYALWCKRQLESLGTDVSGGFDLMPEVQPVLERHLDPQRSLSPVVHSVYGSSLPRLILLDETWVVEHLDRIFPKAPESAALLDAAWVAYVRSCRAKDSAFRVLRAEYEAAIRRMPSPPEPRDRDRFRDDNLRLGEHLVTLFWGGTDNGDLIRQYFHRASDKLTDEVMDFVDTRLANAEDAASPIVEERVQVLCDERRSALRDLIQPAGPAADG